MAKTFEERAASFTKECKQLQAKHQISFYPTVQFPRVKLPMYARFGVWLVKLAGGRTDLQLADIKQK